MQASGAMKAEQESAEKETVRRRHRARDSLAGQQAELKLRRADLAAEATGTGPPGGAGRARDSLAAELRTLGSSLATAAAVAEESDLQLSLWTMERDRTNKTT